MLVYSISLHPEEVTSVSAWTNDNSSLLSSSIPFDLVRDFSLTESACTNPICCIYVYTVKAVLLGVSCGEVSKLVLHIWDI